ncbi:AI-2E family transporter [Paracoccus sp. TK19116]|uniref:AI-2E family transporter n=1 Tax=Paracoccus albicereus TaxID=2922394 RepID=A0ABT1MTI8_9RHOB|nr:AI-2E family transporter [Paracoccus albicereus]MCQ0970821.1 AI-2E family transporter [Paracoccus albicereus]
MPDRSDPHSQPAPTPAVPGTSRGPVPLATILSVFAIAILILAAWRLKTLLLMFFGAVLVAVALRAGAHWIARRSRLSPRIGVLVVFGLAVLVLTALVMWIGQDVSRQFNQLIAGIPQAWTRVTSWLEETNLGQLVREQVRSSGEQGGATGGMLGNVVGVVRGTFTTITGMAANLILILTMAIFLAMDPASYREGGLKLVPMGNRDRAREIVAEIGSKLAKWMAGQSIDMLFVGILSGVGLWLLGVPLALVLGLIAGLTNIIPLIGPFLSGVPAVLFALTQGPQMAIYVAILFTVIQQIEGNILLPMIQKRATNLPPVLTVLGVVGFGALFGLPGIILATPLLIVVMVLVNRLYVEDILEDEAPEEEAETA